MAEQDTPEAGTRCKIKSSQGDEIAVWTGHMWASEDGSRIIDEGEIESWEEAPHEGELEITKQE